MLFRSKTVMHLSTGLFLFLSLLAPLAAASSSGDLARQLSNRNLVRRADEILLDPPVKVGPLAPATTKNPSPGTKDAPVDGQDGKPHSGPMIPKDGPPSGNGAGVPPEVGVSGGAPSVDMSKPPPITGKHEIVDLEGKEGVGKDIKVNQNSPLLPPQLQSQLRALLTL